MPLGPILRTFCATFLSVSLSLWQKRDHQLLIATSWTLDLEWRNLPVVGLVDEVQQDLHHGVEELAGQILRLRAEVQRENVPVSFPTDIQVLLLQEVAWDEPSKEILFLVAEASQAFSAIPNSLTQWVSEWVIYYVPPHQPITNQHPIKFSQYKVNTVQQLLFDG